MAATKPIDTPERAGEVINIAAAAAVDIYAGSLVAVDASGNATPAADTAGLKVIGRAEEDCLNGDGLAAALSCRVKRGVFRFANSASNAVDAGDVGSAVYAEDDTTVATSTNNAIEAGIVVDVDDDGVWVDTRYHLHAVGTLADGAVTLAKLASIISPSHIGKLAGILTMGGGAASEAETVTGALATDIVLATIVDNDTNDDVQLLEAKPSADTITFLFNEDPGAGVKVAYAILRATS